MSNAQIIDDRPVTFHGSLKGVSAQDEKIPDLPVVTIAENEVTLDVEAPQRSEASSPRLICKQRDWQRWNDYGIGLFLQGDLKGAQAAFQKVTEIAPNNPEGWVNIGRCAVQEGDMDQARTVLTKALSINPKLREDTLFLCASAA